LVHARLQRRLAPHLEQRPPPQPVARAHPGQRPSTAAPSESQQDGLGLVIEGVPYEYGDRVHAGGARLERCPASRACGRYGAALGAHLDLDDLDRVESETTALRGGPLGGLRRDLLQPVVDHHRADAQTEPVTDEGRGGRERE
jgi:hypothetical protein